MYYSCIAGALLVYGWCIAGKWAELRTDWITDRLNVVQEMLELCH